LFFEKSGVGTELARLLVPSRRSFFVKGLDRIFG
jgi:hypothetical protein